MGVVTTLVNAILGKGGEGADLNADEAVNVGDVTKLVNVILGKEPAEEEPAELYLSGYSWTDGMLTYYAVGDPKDVESLEIVVAGLLDPSYAGTVTIPTKVKFKDIVKLQDIVFPVTSILEGAFLYCPNFTRINIPYSINSIGDGVFFGCTNLERIVIDKSNKKYDAREGCNAIIETKTNALIAGCKTTTIPSSVTSIWKLAFAGCSSLTNIAIPSSVLSIRESAFAQCTALERIEIPNSVLGISDGAFSGCTSLTSIEIPNSVLSIGDDTFYGCTSLTSIEIPNSVVSIGNSAFSDCTALTSIELPASVTSISEGLFKGCEKLTNVVLPASVTTIGSYAFIDCQRLSAIALPPPWRPLITGHSRSAA